MHESLFNKVADHTFSTEHLYGGWELPFVKFTLNMKCEKENLDDESNMKIRANLIFKQNVISFHIKFKSRLKKD